MSFGTTVLVVFLCVVVIGAFFVAIERRDIILNGGLATA